MLAIAHNGKTLREATHLKMDIVELSKKLIAVPGYVELPEKESRVARVLHEEMLRMGLSATLQDIGEGRYNVICRYKGAVGGKKVVLCTHLDTVPGYEMQDAFVPTVKDGFLYGRGAVDVRGILAVMTQVMQRLEAERPAACGDVEFWAVADEESGSAGMRYAVQQGSTAQLAIVGEPTELMMGTAHKGVAWLGVDFEGKSAHGSMPQQGHNAIYDAGIFITRLQERLIPQLSERTHSVLGCSTLNVGVIEGGSRATVVPSGCYLQMDRRLLPGESAESAADELREQLAELARVRSGLSAEVSIIRGGSDMPFPPLEPIANKSIVDRLCSAATAATGLQTETTGLSYWTDGALSASILGIPTVVFGPGSIKQAHSANEFVEIAQLHKAAEAYYQMVVAFCEM